MLTALNTALEMIATLICVNHLFCKKYYFKIHDAIFLLSEIVVIETANYIGLSKGVALFGYIGIYLYELLKFRCPIRKANVNLILVAIFCVFTQIICSIPMFMFAKWADMDILVMFVNVLILIVFLILGKKECFYKVSQGIMGYEMLNNMAVGICFAGAVYLLVVYKLEEYLRITDYIIFGAWTVLIGVLIMRWQQERFAKLAREEELELRIAYEDVYEQLLESIRRKQHDFHNQIQAICSQHLATKDYDTLVALQKEYCGEILEDNRYASLLSNGSPMLVAFLYSKFLEAEGKGCHIEYNIKVNKLQCQVSQYKMVEMLGALLDNAIEAAIERRGKEIYVELMEDVDKIHVQVKNDSEHFTSREIAAFIKRGYSTKGSGRGRGLAKVVEILYEYGSALYMGCRKEEPDKMIVEFDIAK